jgi:hypothetical protein
MGRPKSVEKATKASTTSSKASTKNSKAKGKLKAVLDPLAPVPGSEYLQQLCNFYFRRDATEVDELNEKNRMNNKGGKSASGKGGKGEGDEPDLCSNENCKRKCSKSVNCIHNYCFQCCYVTPVSYVNDSLNSNGKSNNNGSTITYCTGHYNQKIKKEQEDKYIEEGLNLERSSNKRLKSNFITYEEKFTDYKQTVTIWCSSDFYRSKKISGDVFELAASSERRKEAMRKRMAQRQGQVSSQTPSPRSSPIKSNKNGSSDDISHSTNNNSNSDSSIQVRAWAIVKKEENENNAKNWLNIQTNWLKKQKQMNIEDTSHLLVA